MISRKSIAMLLILFSLLFVSCSGPVAAPDANELLSLGEKYLLELNYEEAIIAFTKAIEIDPKVLPAYLELANAHMAQGDSLAAVNILQEGISARELYTDEEITEEVDRVLVSLQDKLIECIIVLSDEYAKDGMIEDAIQLLTEIMKDYPSADLDQQLSILLKQKSEQLYAEHKGFVDEVATAAMNEDNTAVFDLMKSPEFSECVGIEIEISENDVLKIYRPELLYVGGMEEEVRSGYGRLWTRNYYKEQVPDAQAFKGIWADDYPNGEGVYQTYLIEADLYVLSKIVEGGYLDGYEHGDIKETSYSNQTGYEEVILHYTSENGKPLKVADSEGYPENQYVFAYDQFGRAWETSYGGRGGNGIVGARVPRND